MDIKSAYESQMNKYKSIWFNYPWANKSAYGAWLGQSYFYVRHTTRLISYAGSFFSFNHNDIHNRFLAHAAEEKNHDKLIISDLRNLNIEQNKYKECTPVAALYQTQYYLAEHVSPMALFGYFISLEGLAVLGCKMAAEKIENAYPKNKFTSFLRVHAADDIEHVREAIEIANNVSEREKELIIENMARSTDMYCDLLNHCRQYSKIESAA